ncbi:hypothetical protein BU25DRAFT_353757 [Macroventuria anomochaeta]|uniref:Uncharacterized protein n=1 Tax=Macroventuria anomochaeta TaxID=301207 RepID=A0ACB6RIH8_9PLEO|nr:uncharacterized protein BU25DRAFT_353757 [Macroventuria anomochaeta]KAF2621755.1 hypothetical protein BU25DRAFT_353757 [Macroventuria anomochaeta]
MAQPSFDQTDLNDIFLRAFKDCTTGIINSLSTDANDPATATAVQTILAQLNYDYNRLVYVIDIIQSRVYRDPAWGDAAVAVYDMIATSIDSYFSHPSLPIRGPLLVQHHLMKVLQAQFRSMMAADTWSSGLTLFLAQLCRTEDSIGRLTPGIMLHILSGMVESSRLFGGDNLDLLFEIISSAGPVLDTQALDVVNSFGEKLQLLQERVKDRGNVSVMAVFGLMRLRELGWGSETIKTS